MSGAKMRPAFRERLKIAKFTRELSDNLLENGDPSAASLASSIAKAIFCQADERVDLAVVAPAEVFKVSTVTAYRLEEDDDFLDEVRRGQEDIDRALARKAAEARTPAVSRKARADIDRASSVPADICDGLHLDDPVEPQPSVGNTGDTTDESDFSPSAGTSTAEAGHVTPAGEGESRTDTVGKRTVVEAFAHLPKLKGPVLAAAEPYDPGCEFRGAETGEACNQQPIQHERDGGASQEGTVSDESRQTDTTPLAPGRAVHRPGCTPETCTLAMRCGDAAIARARGWGPGTRIVGVDMGNVATIEITAVGSRSVLARGGPGTSEMMWALSCRCWGPAALDATAEPHRAAASAPEVRDV